MNIDEFNALPEEVKEKVIAARAELARVYMGHHMPDPPLKSIQECIDYYNKERLGD